ncbi:hypothetical protein LguiB_021104 [Lonicera macranthoides]
MALTFASLASLWLSKRASCGTASTSSEPRNAGDTNTSSPTPSCLFSLSPFLSSPQQQYIFTGMVFIIALVGVHSLCATLVSLSVEGFVIWLSVIVLKDPEAALRASILFCFNPASIVYSSMYSSY